MIFDSTELGLVDTVKSLFDKSKKRRGKVEVRCSTQVRSDDLELNNAEVAKREDAGL